MPDSKALRETMGVVAATAAAVNAAQRAGVAAVDECGRRRALLFSETDSDGSHFAAYDNSNRALRAANTAYDLAVAAAAHAHVRMTMVLVAEEKARGVVAEGERRGVVHY
jgi:hypothetical protein